MIEHSNLSDLFVPVVGNLVSTGQSLANSLSAFSSVGGNATLEWLEIRCDTAAIVGGSPVPGLPDVGSIGTGTSTTTGTINITIPNIFGRIAHIWALFLSSSTPTMLHLEQGDYNEETRAIQFRLLDLNLAALANPSGAAANSRIRIWMVCTD
jgi:hypothetical protein